MESLTTYHQLDRLPADMRPRNWLSALGYTEGIVRSGGLSLSLPKDVLKKLHSELSNWDSTAKDVIIAKSIQTRSEATMNFASLKRIALSLPWNSMLRTLILAEPDSLPFHQGIAKIEVFSRLLYRELEKS